MVKKLTRLSRNEEPARHKRAILNDSIFPSDVFCAGVRRNIRLIVKHTEQLTTYAISVVVSIVVFCKCFGIQSYGICIIFTMILQIIFKKLQK